MKKLLMSSAVLFLFSASMFLFQLSCSKTATAGNNGSSGTTTASKLIALNKTANTFNIYNTSGSGSPTVVSVSLPSGFTAQDKEINSDGTYIFFVANSSTGSQFIYRCDMNGSNPIKIVDGADLYDVDGFGIF